MCTLSRVSKQRNLGASHMELRSKDGIETSSIPVVSGCYKLDRVPNLITLNSQTACPLLPLTKAIE